MASPIRSPHKEADGNCASPCGTLSLRMALSNKKQYSQTNGNGSRVVSPTNNSKQGQAQTQSQQQQFEHQLQTNTSGANKNTRGNSSSKVNNRLMSVSPPRNGTTINTSVVQQVPQQQLQTQQGAADVDRTASSDFVTAPATATATPNLVQQQLQQNQSAHQQSAANNSSVNNQNVMKTPQLQLQQHQQSMFSNQQNQQSATPSINNTNNMQQICIPKAADLQPNADRLVGHVHRFAKNSGWGFLRCDNKFQGDLFFHVDNIMEGYQFKDGNSGMNSCGLVPGDVVEFTIMPDMQGRPHGVMIKPMLGRAPVAFIGQRLSGVVRRLEEKWGFVNSNHFDGDLFLHRENFLPYNLAHPQASLNFGTQVEFDVILDERGRTVAKWVAVKLPSEPQDWLGQGRIQGTLKSFQDKWGFVVSDRFVGDLFVHKESIMSVLNCDVDLSAGAGAFNLSAYVGHPVEFEVGIDTLKRGNAFGGRLLAQNVKVLTAENPMYPSSMKNQTYTAKLSAHLAQQQQGGNQNSQNQMNGQNQMAQNHMQMQQPQMQQQGNNHNGMRMDQDSSFNINGQFRGSTTAGNSTEAMTNQSVSVSMTKESMLSSNVDHCSQTQNQKPSESASAKDGNNKPEEKKEAANNIDNSNTAANANQMTPQIGTLSISSTASAQVQQDNKNDDIISKQTTDTNQQQSTAQNNMNSMDINTSQQAQQTQQTQQMNIQMQNLLSQAQQLTQQQQIQQQMTGLGLPGMNGMNMGLQPVLGAQPNMLGMIPNMLPSAANPATASTDQLSTQLQQQQQLLNLVSQYQQQVQLQNNLQAQIQSITPVGAPQNPMIAQQQQNQQQQMLQFQQMQYQIQQNINALQMQQQAAGGVSAPVAAVGGTIGFPLQQQQAPILPVFQPQAVQGSVDSTAQDQSYNAAFAGMNLLGLNLNTVQPQQQPLLSNLSLMGNGTTTATTTTNSDDTAQNAGSSGADAAQSQVKSQSERGDGSAEGSKKTTETAPAAVTAGNDANAKANQEVSVSEINQEKSSEYQQDKHQQCQSQQQKVFIMLESYEASPEVESSQLPPGLEENVCRDFVKGDIVVAEKTIKQWVYVSRWNPMGSTAQENVTVKAWVPIKIVQQATIMRCLQSWHDSKRKSNSSKTESQSNSSTRNTIDIQQGEFLVVRHYVDNESQENGKESAAAIEKQLKGPWVFVTRLAQLDSTQQGTDSTGAAKKARSGYVPRDILQQERPAQNLGNMSVNASSASSKQNITDDDKKSQKPQLQDGEVLCPTTRFGVVPVRVQ